MSATFGFGMLIYGLICIAIASVIIYFVIKNFK